MHGKWFAAAALATAGMLMFALPVRAGDTHRLSMPSRTADAPTLNLVDNGKGADTVSVHGRGGYGGHVGYSHGGYGGFSHGYYGGYGYSRGYYGGYGFRRPYYRFGYYPRYAFGAYYQPYYYAAPSVYYYSAPSCSVAPSLYSSVAVSTPVVSLSINAAPASQRRIEELVAAPALVQPDDQTFPYDGGPRNPAPMPKAEPTPSAPPVDDHSVSLPAKVAGKLVYPAYGEQIVPRFQERGVLVKGEPIKKLAK